MAVPDQIRHAELAPFYGKKVKCVGKFARFGSMPYQQQNGNSANSTALVLDLEVEDETGKHATLEHCWLVYATKVENFKPAAMEKLSFTAHCHRKRSQPGVITYGLSYPDDIVSLLAPATCLPIPQPRRPTTNNETPPPPPPPSQAESPPARPLAATDSPDLVPDLREMRNVVKRFGSPARVRELLQIYEDLLLT